MASSFILSIVIPLGVIDQSNYHRAVENKYNTVVIFNFYSNYDKTSLIIWWKKKVHGNGLTLFCSTHKAALLLDISTPLVSARIRVLDSLMNDKASKNISSCSVSYTALPMTFNQHCLSYKISNRLQIKSSFFFTKNFSKLCYIDTTFFKMCHMTFKRRLSTYIDRYTYILCAIIEGKLVMVFR